MNDLQRWLPPRQKLPIWHIYTSTLNLTTFLLSQTTSQSPTTFDDVLWIMSHHINHLMISRKCSSLTQSDMAYLMNKQSHTNISRCEKGEREPSIEMILMYQLILDVSFEKLFEGYRSLLQENVKERIPSLIETLKTDGMSYRTGKRISYLTAVLERLATIPNNQYDFTKHNHSIVS